MLALFAAACGCSNDSRDEYQGERTGELLIDGATTVVTATPQATAAPGQ